MASASDFTSVSDALGQPQPVRDRAEWRHTDCSDRHVLSTRHIRYKLSIDTIPGNYTAIITSLHESQPTQTTTGDARRRMRFTTEDGR